MRIPILTLIAAVGLIASAAADRPAAAQQPPASADPAISAGTPVEEARHRPDVIVTGSRAEFESKVFGFVNQLTDFEYGDSNRGLARWQDPICPLVTGLSRDMAEYILERVSEIARDVGVLPNTLSSHLTILGHAGLILSRRDGRSLIYSADYEGMRDLLGFLRL